MPSSRQMVRMHCSVDVYLGGMPCIWKSSFTRSSGDTIVRDTAPATPPATRDCQEGRATFHPVGGSGDEEEEEEEEEEEDKEEEAVDDEGDDRTDGGSFGWSCEWCEWGVGVGVSVGVDAVVVVVVSPCWSLIQSTSPKHAGRCQEEQ